MLFRSMILTGRLTSTANANSSIGIYGGEGAADAASAVAREERRRRRRRAAKRRRSGETTEAGAAAPGPDLGRVRGTEGRRRRRSPSQMVSYMAESVVGTSFGIVFQAKCLETGETVAIKKVLQPGPTVQEPFDEPFQCCSPSSTASSQPQVEMSCF